MRGRFFICNTPSAAMASSVLHRPVESAVDKPPLDNLTRRAPRFMLTARFFPAARLMSG